MNQQHEKIENIFRVVGRVTRMRWSNRFVESEGHRLADTFCQITALPKKDTKEHTKMNLKAIIAEPCLAVRHDLFYALCCFLLGAGRARLPALVNILQEKIDMIDPPQRRFDIMRVALADASTR